MRRTWSLSHQRDEGWKVIVGEEPSWTGVVGAVWDGLCRLTRGWVGGHGMPDRLWRIPVGQPKWDCTDPNEPWLENSLPGALFNLESWVLTRADERGRTIAEIPISEDVARQIDPEFVAMLDNDDEAPGVDLAAQIQHVSGSGR